jgi:hypothetical protein
MPRRAALRHHWRRTILLAQGTRSPDAFRARHSPSGARTSNCWQAQAPPASETIELTKLAFDLGYDGVVVLPPYYFRKATDDGLFNWFSELIEQSRAAGKAPARLSHPCDDRALAFRWICSNGSKPNSRINLQASKTHPTMKPLLRPLVNALEKTCSSSTAQIRISITR